MRTAAELRLTVRPGGAAPESDAGFRPPLQDASVKRSTNRIPTTHVGSLVRPVDVLRGMKARTIEQPYDQSALADAIRTGIHDVLRRQVEVGIDIPSDGEF